MSDELQHASDGPQRRIPGPRGLELWRFLLHFGARPHEHLLELALKYGDIVRLAFPGETVVLIANPDYIEHILHHRHQHYDKQTARWESVRQVWGNSLLTADGDLWRRQRQRMQPAFHHEAMRRFAGVVVEEVQRISAVWSLSSQSGESRDVYQDMLACASRAITRASFGSDIDDKTEIINRALADVHGYINPMAPLNLLRVPHAIQRVVNPEYRRFQPAYRTIHGIFDTIVANRLSAGAPSRADLLGLMMAATDDETSKGMTPAQLHDEMMGILMAGHETTGIAAAWSWYWLARYPEVERTLHAELDAVLAGRMPTYDDLARLPYTQMVFQESLRICPPTWGMDRRAREDDVIGGFVIPRGTKVAFSPYVMHHHPKYWDEPEEFNPRRFSPDQSAGRPPYAYLPFGGGPRRCVGMRFAQLEGQLILAALAQSFAVRLKPGVDVRPTARVTLQPAPGVQLLLEPRQVPATAS
jgi:cytochrome P450